MRRVLDNISLEAINELDEDIANKIIKSVGLGKEVEPFKQAVKLSKNPLGMYTYTFIQEINRISTALKKHNEECSITTSSGNTIITNSNVVNFLKAITIYRVNCPAILANSLGIVLKYIDEDLSDKNSNKVSNNTSDNKFTSLCKTLVYNELNKLGLKQLKVE